MRKSRPCWSRWSFQPHLRFSLHLPERSNPTDPPTTSPSRRQHRRGDGVLRLHTTTIASSPKTLNSPLTLQDGTAIGKGPVRAALLNDVGFHTWTNEDTAEITSPSPPCRARRSWSPEGHWCRRHRRASSPLISISPPGQAPDPDQTLAQDFTLQPRPQHRPGKPPRGGRSDPHPPRRCHEEPCDAHWRQRQRLCAHLQVRCRALRKTRWS